VDERALMMVDPLPKMTVKSVPSEPKKMPAEVGMAGVVPVGLPVVEPVGLPGVVPVGLPVVVEGVEPGVEPGVVPAATAPVVGKKRGKGRPLGSRNKRKVVVNVI
jgi:hypothetical protein